MPKFTCLRSCLLCWDDVREVFYYSRTRCPSNRYCSDKASLYNVHGQHLLYSSVRWHIIKIKTTTCWRKFLLLKTSVWKNDNVIQNKSSEKLSHNLSTKLWWDERIFQKNPWMWRLERTLLLPDCVANFLCCRFVFQLLYRRQWTARSTGSTSKNCTSGDNHYSI